MTHDELLERAAEILSLQHYDATYLYEVKVSYSDFKRDLEKFAGKVSSLDSFGTYKYYIMPAELSKKVKSEVSDGWGLLKD